MVSGSISLPFRGTFHLSLAVLVHYRLARVFSLIPWSGQIRTKFLPLCYLGTKFILLRFCVPDFHCLWLFIPKYSTTKKEWIILAPQPPTRAQRENNDSRWLKTDFHRWLCNPLTISVNLSSLCYARGLGFSVFRSPPLHHSFSSPLFLNVSPRVPSRFQCHNQKTKLTQNLNFKKFWDISYSFDIWYLSSQWNGVQRSFHCAGFPHSETTGSKVGWHLPGAIAAASVLLQLLLPRHPPFALWHFKNASSYPY